MSINSVLNKAKKESILYKRKISAKKEKLVGQASSIFKSSEYRVLEPDVANLLMCQAKNTGIENLLHRDFKSVKQFSISKESGEVVVNNNAQTEFFFILPIDTYAWGGLLIDSVGLNKYLWKISDFFDDDLIIFDSTLNSSIKFLGERNRDEISNVEIFIRGKKLDFISQ